ncbi:SDR family NAD(P)-dependent oxidoreductase [Tropicimonas isoalkanivorans]|uniref:3-oxoacyl-[acyl-carrier protein] reductase n=1 Tax=Tropicimonas isoalkanivorans TaxID=441112 RepID=A0A1I1HD00_9RHOB|nr:3-oxoacyl-ACP reductase family protein [Tropicimonas isoalkanivorans]SFC21721.1 3-oxoacyl-[acyl-carrier protein] reductase [Tropicimonas isoalkanivorans]
MKLAGKVALVTGGSRGIGRAIALAFAAQGARVVICHPGDPEAEATQAAIGHWSDGLAIQADVSNEDAVERTFEMVERHFGTPEILVNNAGILRQVPLIETDAEDFDRVIAVNLRGPFLTCRAFARRAQAGRIINIASDLGFLGREQMAAYTASKGGVIAMTRTLARELAPGILVNAIAPGSVETDMTSPASMTPDQIARDLDTPLARFGQPEEIASMALYLASDDSSFVTGQCFGVNGGSAMY